MAQMPEAEKKIIEEVDYFRDKYFTYDLPVPFGRLTLYPVSIKDYNEFLSSSACLTLNKNDDIAGIRMTNIDYLLSKMQDEKEGPMWSLRFTKIIELCFHIKSGLKCPKCGKFMSFEEFYIKYEDKSIIDKNSILDCECGSKYQETIKFKENEKGKKIFIFDGVEVDNQTFNKLRKYIMYQNLPDYKDDSWVDKAIRDDQAAKNELKSRGSGTASLERKIIGVCVNTHWKIEEVMNMTIRKFLMVLGMVDDIMNYTITRTGLMSGFASLPKGETVEHWLYKKDEGLYGKAMDVDAYTSQIKNA
jgi:hypothetical protein